MTRVPLRWQPTNPPSPYIGRADLQVRLGEGIARAPVSIVWGFSGAGKSALVAHVLATRFDALRAQMLVVDVRDVDGPDPDGASVVRLALERLRSFVALDANLEDAPAALLEALETNDVWLVLENVERVVPGSSLAELLELTRRFARRAKLLVICREDPRLPQLAGQTFAVGLMEEHELRALLAAVRPGVDAIEAQSLAALARGSPWRLLQLSVGGQAAAQGPEASLLALSAVAQGILHALALTAHPIPRAALLRSVRGADEQTLELLARRGYLDAEGRGVRLHDAARALVAPQLEDDERALRAPRLLRAILEHGGGDGAHAALALARAVSDEALLRELIASCGLALRSEGASGALWELLLASPERIGREHYGWLCVMALDVSGAALARVPAPAKGDPSAEAWFAYVEKARAGAPFALLPTPDDGPLAASLTEAARAIEAADRALAAGQPREAQRLAQAVEAASSTIEGRALNLVRGRAALAAAAFERARALLEPLVDGADVAIADRARLELVALGLAEGDAETHDADPTAALAIAMDEHGASIDARARLDEVRAAWRSDSAHEDAAPRAPLFAGEALKTIVGALPGGDLAACEREALKLRGSARDAGALLAALEAGVLALDCALARGDRERAATLAQQLHAEASQIGSRRFVLEARFAHACTRSPMDPAALVELSARKTTNPVVARRAAALLGENAQLDALDRLVLQALGARADTGGRVIESAGAAQWTLDAGAMRILLDDGRAVDLSAKKVLFDLVLTLARRGGAATKEQLLETAWGVREYHPLRHDNRLKVAVRKLRRLLEETLGDDPIEATEDGYRLRGHVRVVRDRAAG